MEHKGYALPPMSALTTKDAPKSMEHTGYVQSVSFELWAGFVFSIEEDWGDERKIFKSELPGTLGYGKRVIAMLIYLADGYSRVKIERASGYRGWDLVSVEGVGVGWDLALLKCGAGDEAARQATIQ